MNGTTDTGLGLLEMSRQKWKLRTLIVGLAVGGILGAYDVFVVELEAAISPFPLLVGLMIFWSSAAFACISIRCPSCGARWLWRAVNSRGSIGGGWMVQLMSGEHCPECGWPREEATSEVRTTETEGP